MSSPNIYVIPTLAEETLFSLSDLPLEEKEMENFLDFTWDQKIQFLVTFQCIPNESIFCSSSGTTPSMTHTSSKYKISISNVNDIGSRLQSRLIVLSKKDSQKESITIHQYLVKDFGCKSFLELKSIVDYFILKIQ